MLFNTPDPSNAPELSIRQQFNQFIQNGGNPEKFAIQMNPSGQVGKIVEMRAYLKGGAVTLLSREINTTKKYTTIPEFSEQSIKELKRKTVTDMERALRDIGTTREILTGKKRVSQVIDFDEILGNNAIGHRYTRTSQNLSIAA